MNYRSFNIDLMMYNPDLIRDGLINKKLMLQLRQGVEDLNTKNVAILAPGVLTRYVTEIIPEAKLMASTEFEPGYDHYIVCCSPFIYFEVVSDLSFQDVDKFIFPFDTSPLNDMENIYNNIDIVSWNNLVDKYKSSHADVNAATKYFDINVYLAEAVQRVWKLNFHLQQPMKILDIGSGACLFPFACNYYGHTSYGVDLSLEDIHPCYIDLAQLLNVKVFYTTIGTPFKKFGTNFSLSEGLKKKIQSPKRLGGVKGYSERFDYVTAFATCFSEGWEVKDYKLFFNCLRMYSNDRGLGYYSLPNPSSMIADEIFPALISIGAEIRKFRVINGFVREIDVFLG